MRKFTVIGLMAIALVAFTAYAYAGEGCSSHQKASAKSAAACQYKQQTAMQNIDVETTRMPSGALVVFYSSSDATVVSKLQASVENGEFNCGVCKQVSASENCSVEIASIDGGVIAVITSEDATAVDAYEKQFAALTSASEPALN